MKNKTIVILGSSGRIGASISKYLIKNGSKVILVDKKQTKKISIKEFIENLEHTQFVQEMPWGGPNVFFMEKLSRIAKNKKIKVMFNADGADEVFGGYKKYLTKNVNLNSQNYFNLQIDGSINHKEDILKKNNYEGAFTLETSRGMSATSTASNNINYIKQFFHAY